jgi:hypothetical protein
VKGGELMMLSKWKPVLSGMIVAALMSVTPAVADQWNERSIMTFSEAVRVPGATLAPGTYVFELAEPDSSPHVIRIRNEKTSDVVATVQAVPVKRNSASGETILRFNPTEQGAPVALRAWFYPNSLYGHQFVYDDMEARDIASRTKTIVLTMERPNGDGRSGTLMVYDASGLKKAYSADAATTREWESWTGNHQASAPVVRADSQAQKVTVDRLEDNAKRYIGQKVSVDAEVQDVYGPRLFTIDEPNWGDLEGEIFVYMPNASAVAVDEHDRVTVSGTVRQFVLGDVQREWGWTDLSEDVMLRLQQRPIVIADRIVGGDSDSVFVIGGKAPATATGKAPATTAAAAKPESNKPALNNQPITKIQGIVDDEGPLVGRRVKLSGVQVDKPGEHGGFIARNGDEKLFVLMPESNQSIRAGNTVSIEGIVLRTPASMESRLDALDLSTDDVYVYATQVS